MKPGVFLAGAGRVRFALHSHLIGGFGGAGPLAKKILKYFEKSFDN